MKKIRFPKKTIGKALNRKISFAKSCVLTNLFGFYQSSFVYKEPVNDKSATIGSDSAKTSRNSVKRIKKH